MENDVSVELVEADTSKSQVQPVDELKQDASFITPTKAFDFIPPGNDTTPRRSPRVPKPRQFTEDVTPDSRISWDETESPGTAPSTAPSTPKTPKSKITSTPRIFSVESEVDTPASPNLEAVCSNDSFVIPTSICKVLQVSPRNTPSKSSSGSGSTPSKKTPGKFSDPLNKSGPSPYKSHRPKYLPKNIKLVKKKRIERNDYLQKIEKFDAQLLKLPSTLQSPKRALNPASPCDGDLMGTQAPLFVIFNPQNFFVTFDEHSFDTEFDTNIAALIRFVTFEPHLAKVEDTRALALFLTVTSNKFLFDTMSPLVEDNLKSDKYVLDWKDLKCILVNFGLTKERYEFDSACYSGLVPPKSPHMWNFKFLFMVVKYSFPSYPKGRLMKLLKFLNDCVFEPIVQSFVYEIVFLMRSVAKHLLQNGTTAEELVPPFNHFHHSLICNRVIIQYLNPDPILRPLSRKLAYRTIHALLQADYFESSNIFSRIADLLDDVSGIMEKTGVKEVYQLICICENLVAVSPFDREMKTFLEKLADFADHMSLSYSYFENLYFTDTVTRLRTLSTINRF